MNNEGVLPGPLRVPTPPAEACGIIPAVVIHCREYTR